MFSSRRSAGTAKAEATDKAVIAPTPCGHEQPRGCVRSGDCKDLAIENLDAVKDRQSSPYQVLRA
jgi:hypothetical protein